MVVFAVLVVVVAVVVVGGWWLVYVLGVVVVVVCVDVGGALFSSNVKFLDVSKANCFERICQ